LLWGILSNVTLTELLKNWVVITLANLVGAIFVAYVFGVLAGTLTTGDALKETLHVAQTKLNANFLRPFVQVLAVTGSLV
jgi:formate/nitrite transporter FocA (FNT family)